MNITRIASGIFIAIAVIALLILGKDFILPLILAILIWFLIKEIRKIFSKIPVVGSNIPKWILSVLATLMLFVISGLIIGMVVENIDVLSENIGTYQMNFDIINLKLETEYDVNVSQLVSTYLGDYDFSTIFNQLLTSITDLFSRTFIIGFYVLFLFVEENVFSAKLLYLYPEKTKFDDVSITLDRISAAISKYISLKTLVSLITGVSSFMALLIIGVDTPLFWAFLIFILSFIPVVGALIAVLFPATIALFQFGDLAHFFLVLGVIGFIQLLVGNILEPKIMGNSLNVSSLVVILSLSFWGMIWGITGMVLSVPITVIMIIFFSQFPLTKSVAIILSEKGEV
jgi:predicted PurR-regulated permease PerM